jgi:phosphate transport system substrate-binding protein
MKRITFAAAGLALFGAATILGAQALQVDAALKPYQKVSGISGSLSSIGSDTMNNMMTLWAETFRRHYPNVKIQVEGKGSSTAPPALLAGTAQFGPMSREMRQAEIDQFEVKYGYKPTQLKTSYDSLAVYVHKDNPIQKLTLAQVEAIFSKSRKRGHKEDIRTWGQLGLTGDWASRPISLYGRNSASGTYGFFKEHTLKNGDFKTTVKEQPGSASVVQGVAEDRYGIGYSGIGYKTSNVKVVAIGETDKSAFSDGSYADVVAGKYPIWRFLYIYVNKAPGKALDPLVGEFVKLIFSKEGQEAVVKDGYYPLSAALAAAEVAKISK